ncbi:MAG: TetR/AcrR family transcriptional regulator [Terracidiphilus sp.]|jgi:AcrR family transcriptional regulator
MRKEPRQARAQVTVEAILEAAARILDRQGWERFTTNGVAETAGVSIGSLYQYFPNKLALVEAILQRHFDAVLSALRSADERTSRGERIEGLISGRSRLISVVAFVGVLRSAPDAHLSYVRILLS